MATGMGNGAAVPHTPVKTFPSPAQDFMKNQIHAAGEGQGMGTELTSYLLAWGATPANFLHNFPSMVFSLSVSSCILYRCADNCAPH